jgi:hypothetical protein
LSTTTAAKPGYSAVKGAADPMVANAKPSPLTNCNDDQQAGISLSEEHRNAANLVHSESSDNNQNYVRRKMTDKLSSEASGIPGKLVNFVHAKCELL